MFQSGEQSPTTDVRRAIQREFGIIETGVDDYLLKPVSRDTLIEITEDMLTATSSELSQ